MVLKWLWVDPSHSLPGEAITEKLFSTVKKELFISAENKKLCKDQITRKYLKESIKLSKYIIVSKPDDSSKEFEGFAAFDILENSLDVHLICSGVKGVGTKIMDAILEYSKQNSSIKNVVLESIGPAYNFYVKKGFELYCPEDAICPMIYVKK